MSAYRVDSRPDHKSQWCLRAKGVSYASAEKLKKQLKTRGEMVKISKEVGG